MKTQLRQFGSDLISQNYAGLVRAAEAPVLDTSCAALLALSRGVREQGYKTVLAGEGADEGFAGYVWFKVREAGRRLDIGDSFRPSTLLGRLTRKIQAPNRSLAEFAHIDALIGGPHAQSMLYNLVSTARDRYYSENMWERLDGHVAYEDIDLDLERMKRWHPLNRSLYLGYKVHLPGLLLSQKGDRVAMANGVEVRVPLLDPELVDLAARLPVQYKQRGGTGKWILREAMRPYLPPEVLRRPKAGFGAPIRNWLRGPLAPLVDDLLSTHSLESRGLFDPAGVWRLIGLDRDQRYDASYTIFSLMCIELWCRIFVDKPVPALD